MITTNSQIEKSHRARLDAGAACLAAAHKYQELGWSVLPLCPPTHIGVGKHHQCNSPGKAPIVPWKEFQSRIATPEEINAWWKENPLCNVGIVLGRVSNLVRVDVDSETGRRLLEEKSGGDLPDTLEFYRAGTDSRGLLYTIPAGVAVKTTSHQGDGLHDELRFQAEGAQTVLPPSRHKDGKPYEWVADRSLDDLEAALAPAWLIKELRVVNNHPPYQRNGKEARSGYTGPPSSSEKVLVGCAFMRHCQDDASTLSEEKWYMMVSNIARTDEGTKLVHRLSEPHPNYSIDETDRKIQHTIDDSGPHTCQFISERTGHRFCRDCPSWGKIKSPVVLGHVAPRQGKHRIRNAVVHHADDTKTTAAIPMGQIISDIREATDGWPCRVQSALFVPNPPDGVSWLISPAALFGWLRTTVETVKWHRGSTMVTKEELFAELQRTATSYTAIETAPHEPQIDGHYYACPKPPASDGTALRGLIERFCPEKDIDRDLITAMFVTPLWGGAGGTRPAFVVTSDAGRGSGKSTLASLVGYLFGGHIELSANEDAAVIKQRLLSPEGISKRVALLDNVKTLRFSSADLEGIITCPVISGKRLYVGEGSRPNCLTWVITLNGVSLATDMAQRSVVIKLAKPTHSGTWKEDTTRYIDNNRQAIIGDLIALLQTDRFPLQQYSRWSAWERDVLQRLPEPAEAQRVILERQTTSDVEAEESDIIEEFFKGQLDNLTYNTEVDRVFIPSGIAGRWYNWATNEKHSVTAVSRMLKQKISEGKLRRLSECPNRNHGRGFIWEGSESDFETPIRFDMNLRISELKKRQVSNF